MQSDEVGIERVDKDYASIRAIYSLGLRASTIL